MKFALLFLTLILTHSAYSYEAQIRKAELEGNLTALLQKATADTGVPFKESNFQLIEERNLATSKYLMFVQVVSNIPVAKTAVRIWIDLDSGELILAEMHLDEKAVVESSSLKAKYQRAKFSSNALKSNQLKMAIDTLIAKEIAQHKSDNQILSMKFQDQWLNGDLVRSVTVRGRRGVHHIVVSLLKNRIIEKSYREFPQSEKIMAHVYPIYEEVEQTGEILPYELREIKYLDSKIKNGGELPLGEMTEKSFHESNYNPLLAGTPYGDMVGLWSEASIRKKIEAITAAHPVRENSFENGLLLQGKYATINLHPAAKEAFKDINFNLQRSVNHIISWRSTANGYVAVPVSGFFGKTIKSREELLAKMPVRLENHDTVSYINSGVDEVQVYYGVTVLMEALAEMGLTDPEISTAPFHAFLFDPDIASRDNAYYWDNTINFTTYSPNQANYARDNATIWHELGHGIMDRLMGPHLGFADSKGGYGGLSEGMADFIAYLVIQHQTNGNSFAGKEHMRIINKTGFYLTNEFHDEGEAYGGAMKDMLDTVMEKEGRSGLFAFNDLTLEAMRLTRNHPALSARGWFEHMLYADELGSSFRRPNQYREIIIGSLEKRNFSFSREFTPSSMTVTFGDTELTNQSNASRERPLTPCAEDEVSFDLKVKLSEGHAKFISFPAIVKVEYKKGALQGAIKWADEGMNPQVYVVNSEDEILSIPLKASMTCEYVNQGDGSCKDYAYIQVWGNGESRPMAKKRFYLQLNKEACSSN